MKAILFAIALLIAAPVFAQTETPTDTPTATPTPTNTPTNTPALASDCCDCGFGQCVTVPFNDICPPGCSAVYGAACLEDGCATHTPTPDPNDVPTSTPTSAPPTATHTWTPVPAAATNTPANTPLPTPDVCSSTLSGDQAIHRRLFSLAGATPAPVVNDPPTGMRVVPIRALVTIVAPTPPVVVYLGGTPVVTCNADCSESVELGPVCSATNASYEGYVDGTAGGVGVELHYTYE